MEQLTPDRNRVDFSVLLQPKCQASLLCKRTHLLATHHCNLSLLLLDFKTCRLCQAPQETPTSSRQFCSFHLCQLSGSMLQILMSKHLLLSEANLPGLTSLPQHEVVQTLPIPFVITHAGLKLNDSSANSWRADNYNTKKLK